ncbi:MAG: Small-conductance mechanosensitive channel-like protein [Acidimicrobiaceae bacterium]|nr:Small-conductance mechanosensitive channel-like protein [Acidimicrobiaceae bacterium]
MSPVRRRKGERNRVAIAPETLKAGRRHLLRAFVYGAIAIAAFGVGSSGTLHPRQVAGRPQIEPRVLAAGGAVAFVFFGIFATRRLANGLGAFMTARTARAAGGAVRLVVTAVGYIVVLFGTLGLLGVNAGHLLVGGTVAGVVIGIAAQQSLSNVFAGFVLQFARPFTIGDNIRVRAGALNGPFDGVVLGMSLTYVTLFSEGGVLRVPNSGMLAAAVGQYPAKDRGVVDAARAAGAPFTPPQGTVAVPGPAMPGQGPEDRVDGSSWHGFRRSGGASGGAGAGGAGSGGSGSADARPGEGAPGANGPPAI